MLQPAAAVALRHARGFAPAARTIAVHTLKIPYRGLMPADTGGTFHAAAEAAAWRKTQDLPADVGKVELIEGAVDPVLIRLLHREDAALLAVDAHSRNRLHAALVGRIAAQLKRDLPSDLPIVRAD